MDEPTRGVDVAAKAEIVDTMRRLAGEGIAIVFATSELADIEAAATRAVVMARGRITADLSGPGMTGEALASAASATPGDEGGARLRSSSFGEVSPERTARRRTDV
jgi:erythritol transport system ATP-binding protein